MTTPSPDLRRQLDAFAKGDDWDVYRRLGQAVELIEEADAALAAAEQEIQRLRRLVEAGGS